MRRRRRLATLAGSGPVFIADGHHRYETAIRYRDERRMTRSCEEDPAFDYLLMLFLDAADQLTVLPTHRVVRGLGDAGAAGLPGALEPLFTVTATARRRAGGAVRGRGRAHRRGRAGSAS